MTKTENILKSPLRLEAIARVKDIRIRRGETTNEWGDFVGVSASTVNRWESPGHTANPSARNLMQICLRCDISPTWLLFGLGQRRLSGIEAYIRNHNNLAAGLNLTDRLDLACEDMERLGDSIETIRLKPEHEDQAPT